MVIIITGSRGSGKEKLLSLVSEIPPIEIPQAGTSNGDTMTVSLGRVAIKEDLFLYLLDIPFEAAYRFLWQRAEDGLVGYVVVHDESGDLAPTKEVLEALKGFVEAPWVVAVHSSSKKGGSLKQLAAKLVLPKGVDTVAWSADDKNSGRKVIGSVLKLARDRAAK